MSEGTEIPAVLERHATCPICKRFYHNIDVHNNPIPSKKNKRALEELCQCQKGTSAREFRRQYRAELQQERERQEAHRDDILGMEERNRQYWQRVRTGTGRDTEEVKR